jgi:hypothetical protein
MEYTNLTILKIMLSGIHTYNPEVQSNGSLEGSTELSFYFLFHFFHTGANGHGLYTAHRGYILLIPGRRPH